MSNSIVINRSEHLSLLADHRVDPITKKLLEVGDEVCVCAKCKTVYLKDVWINSKKNTCCDQSKTVLQIHNIEYEKFEKKIDKIVEPQKKTNNAFIFFLLTTILLGILAWYWYNIYNKEHDQKEYIQQKVNSLNYKISNETTQNKQLNEKVEIQDKKIVNLELDLSDLKNNVEEIEQLNFRIGQDKNDESRKYDISYSMFLEVKKPIKLKYVFIKANKKGLVKVGLYDMNNNIKIDSIEKKITNSYEWSRLDLYFDIKISGNYYLKAMGEIELLYNNSRMIDYDFYENDVIKILGFSNTTTNYTDKRYYQYYYDIHYSLLIEEE